MSIAEGSVRVYRHWPWLVLNTLVAVFVGGLVVYAVRAPSIETIAKVLLFLVPLVAFEAYLVPAFRVRTVVDGAGITQHWISRSYRVPYAEGTGWNRCTPTRGGSCAWFRAGVVVPFGRELGSRYLPAGFH